MTLDFMWDDFKEKRDECRLSNSILIRLEKKYNIEICNLRKERTLIRTKDIVIHNSVSIKLVEILYL